MMHIRHRLAALFGTVAIGAFSAAALKWGGSPPNVELVMTFVMSAGLALGPLAGLATGLLTKVLYDFFALQPGPGPWTLITAPSFAIAGLLAGLVPMLFAGRRHFSRIQLAGLAVVLTVVYDILTLIGFSALFSMPMLAALGPQVPFTLMHIAGNAAFAFALVPVLSSVMSRMAALDALESGAPAPRPARYKF